MAKKNWTIAEVGRRWNRLKRGLIACNAPEAKGLRDYGATRETWKLPLSATSK